MKTTLNNRAEFISYRSQMVTEVFGKQLMLAFAMIGLATLSQISKPDVPVLDDSVMNSITLTDEARDSSSEIFEDTLPALK